MMSTLNVELKNKIIAEAFICVCNVYVLVLVVGHSAVLNIHSQIGLPQEINTCAHTDERLCSSWMICKFCAGFHFEHSLEQQSVKISPQVETAHNFVAVKGLL